MHLGIILLALLITSGSFPQTGRSAIQLSGLFPTYGKNIFNTLSVPANAASSLQAESISGVIYKEQKFLLKDLGVFYGAVVKPISNGAVALSIQHSGLNTFRETSVSIIYAKPLGRADLAAKFNYIYTAMEGYKPSGVTTITIAGIFHLSEQCHSGFQIEHVNSVFSSKDKLRFPQPEYRFGFGYDISSLVHLNIDCEMEQVISLNVNTCIAYQFHSKCRLLLGLGSFIPIPWFGAEFTLHAWKVGMKTIYHRQLGVTPALWISFQQKVPK